MSNRIASVLFLAVLIAPISGTATEAPAARYQVDPARNRAWSVNHEGVVLVEQSKSRTVLALPEWVWVHEPYGCPPDLALGPKGEAVITSNVLSTLWRIDPETLAVSVHRLALDADGDKDVGFSALAYSREHGAFFAASYSHGSLWKIDPELVTARKVPQSAPVRQACGLPLRDGL